MGYDHGSRENRHRAASLLGDLRQRLPDASDCTEHPATEQARTSARHWRISNVSGVHVYQDDEGWQADLTFQDLPAGVPTIVGNARPTGSRQEALESATRHLSATVQREKAMMQAERKTFRWFVFDEVEIPVDPDYLPGVAASLIREGYTADKALGRLAYLRHVIADDGPLTAAKVEAADDRTRERLSVVCEVAMALGLTGFSLANGIWADHAPTAPGMH